MFPNGVSEFLSSVTVVNGTKAFEIIQFEKNAKTHFVTNNYLSYHILKIYIHVKQMFP